MKERDIEKYYRCKIHARKGPQPREDRRLDLSRLIAFSNMPQIYPQCNNGSPSDHARFAPGLGNP